MTFVRIFRLQIVSLDVQYQVRLISLKHSHKKRKDSLETRAVLLIFPLEIEISGEAVQSIHQNSKKWRVL